MKTNRITLASRSATALAIAVAIALGGAGVASASGHHDSSLDGAKCASGRVSSFDYANVGLGGYVTAVTTTSVTVARWGGTTTTFNITSATTIDVGTTTTTLASLVVGDRVRIQAAPSDPTTATSITIELAMLFGTVASVNGNTINLTDPQGFTRTILVSSATTYEAGGSAATLADVVVGAKIIARGTVDANGTTLDALSVDIGSAGNNQFVTGDVTAVTSSSVTIESHVGATTTFTLTSTTLYREGPLTLSAADLAVGEHVSVEFNSTAATTAVRIDIRLSHAEGRVTAVSANVITLSGPQGSSGSIIVSSSTLYYHGRTPATLSDVVPGVWVAALGTVDADGTSLDGLYVEIVAQAIDPPSPQGPVSGTFGGNGNSGDGGHSDGGGNDNGGGANGGVGAQFSGGHGHHHGRHHFG